MQKAIFIFIIILGQASIGLSQSIYQISSCRIDFSFDNGIQKGSKTLIFSDSGQVEKVYSVVYIDTSTDRLDTKKVYRSLTIQDKDSITSVNLDSMIGYKQQRLRLDLNSILDDEKKKIGEEIYLNRNCDIVDFNGFKLWYWKGIILKKELTLEGNKTIYEKATSIDENYVISAEEFKVPSGVSMQ